MLPLGGDTIVWVSEIILDAPFPRTYTPRGYVFSFIDGVKLATGQQPAQLSLIGDPRPMVLTDTMLQETFDHVPDGRGGWFGIARSAESNRFQRWRLTKDSFEVLVPIRVGPVQTDQNQLGTRLKFRPQGDAFAIVGADSSLALYRFDRRTADITLWAHLPTGLPEPWWKAFRFRHDAEWSADGRYLYISYQGAITRFDTEAVGRADAWQPLVDPHDDPYAVSYFELERGPDCRIYVGPAGASKDLSVIDDPGATNAGVAAASIQKDGVHVGRWYFVSLPDHPDYAQWSRDRLALGLSTRIDTATCDPTLPPYPYRPFGGVVAVEEVLNRAAPRTPDEVLRASPNPLRSGEAVYLRFGLGGDGAAVAQAMLAEGPVVARVVDGLGREFGLGVWAGEATALRLPAGLRAGVYTVLLQAGGIRRAVRIVVAD